MTDKQWLDWKALVAACKNPNTTHISVHGIKRRKMIIALDNYLATIENNETPPDPPGLATPSGVVNSKNQPYGTPEKKKYMKKYCKEHKAVTNSYLAFGK